MVSKWQKILEGLGSFQIVEQDKEFSKKLKSLAVNLETDLEHLQNERSSVFLVCDSQRDTTDDNIELLQDWAHAGQAPSLAALSIFALDILKVDLDRDYECVLMMAAALGEIPNELPYHNNMHFRKVLLQLIRLLKVHDDTAQGTSQALSQRETALLLIAGCIHDYRHDGQGNTVKGVFEPSRLELRSFDLALPFLIQAGLVDETDQEDLKIMLLATDVTPLDDPASPMRQMKAAFRYHFLGEQKGVSLNLDPGLKKLESDKRLTLMSLYLHEADIATSAGLSYEVTQYETHLLQSEIGQSEARPHHILNFLDQICQRRFLSHAGQELYAANLARIYALAEEDQAAGDAPFEKTELPSFYSEDTGSRMVTNSSADTG